MRIEHTALRAGYVPKWMHTPDRPRSSAGKGAVRAAAAAAAILLGGCSSGDSGAPTASGASPAISSAPVATASGSTAEPSATSGPFAKDEPPARRAEICARLVGTSRKECGKNEKVEKALVDLCTAHPIWECGRVPTKDLEACWVPIRKRVDRSSACADWGRAIEGCDLEGKLRARCTGYLDKVIAGSPAAKAGLIAGDRLVAVDGAPFSALGSLSTLVERSEGKAMKLTIRREGKADQEIEVKPTLVEGFYRIGVVPGFAPDCPLAPDPKLTVCAPP